MDTTNILLLAAAGVLALVALLMLWRQEFGSSDNDWLMENGEAGGKRKDLARRDWVRELVRTNLALLHRYRFRNRLIMVIAALVLIAWVVGFRQSNRASEDAGHAASQAQTAATKASDAAAKASDGIDQIQAERRRNTRRACLQAHERDVDLDKNNAGLRGFILATLPPSVRRNPEVAAYLRRHPMEFPPGPVLGAERPDRQPVPAEFIVAYLRRAADTWPVIKAARRKPKQVRAACEAQVRRTVGPPPSAKSDG